MRDYGVSGQIGLEPTIEEYLERLLAVFDEVKRVLRGDGVCFVNLGDSYSSATKGSGGTEKGRLNTPTGTCPGQFFGNARKVNMGAPEKSLCLIPYRFAQAMIERSWVLRNIIVWHKPNAMPHSVKDRFTVDFEPVFFFVKSQKYWFKQQFDERTSDNDGIYRYDGKYKNIDIYNHKGNSAPNPTHKNKRTVWSINTASFSEAHFAVFPEELASTLIDCGCPPGGVVLDPFCGAGTVALCAERLGMKWVGIELNPAYCKIIEDRVRMETMQGKLPFDFGEEELPWKTA